MNIRDSFFISDFRIKIERKLEVYNPNLVSHLSKQFYDKYLIKLKIYNEVLEVLETNDMTQGKIEEFLHKKIILTNKLIKLAEDPSDYKKQL